jgi:hypothetical protein
VTKSKAQREREDREYAERYEAAIAAVLAAAPPHAEVAARLRPILEATNFPFSAQASAASANSSPSRRGDVVAVFPPRPGDAADGSAGSTRADCRGSQPARGSAVIPGAPATTRKKNAPGVDVSGVDREGAPTTPAA